MIKELDKLIDKSEPIEVTIDELVQWKNHPVTKRLYNDFLTAYLDEVDFMSNHVPYDDEARATHAATVGRMAIYTKFLNYVEDEKAQAREVENDD